MSTSELVANYLLQIKAIKLSPQSPFTWASGIKSPIYCDNRLTLSYPEVRNAIVDAFVKVAKSHFDFDAIAGVATAGIPHGALLADRLGLPFAYVRSKAKAHGRQNQIEGQIPEGAKVLVIEDLISTGGSSLQAVDALKQAGVQVAGVLAIFTYQLPEAIEAFKTANCALATLSDYETLIQFAIDQQYIEQKDYQLLSSWKDNPKGWMPN